jgi:hypothetical protein
VHVPRFSADKSLIRFDGAGHFVEGSVVHRVTNSLQHEPSGLLSDSKATRDFVAANTVLAIRQHPHRCEPFIETNRRIFKDCPDLHGELLLAIQAFPHQARLEKRQPTTQAPGAERAIWPSNVSNSFDARLGVRKEPYGF